MNIKDIFKRMGIIFIDTSITNKVTYESEEDKSKTHPNYIKEYRKHWYLFGLKWRVHKFDENITTKKDNFVNNKPGFKID